MLVLPIGAGSVEFLISAPGRTYICEQCVESSRRILEERGFYRDGAPEGEDVEGDEQNPG